MLMHYDADEWFPVLRLSRSSCGIFDVQPQEFTEEEIADLMRVNKEFNEWQQKIADRFGVKRVPPSSLISD